MKHLKYLLLLLCVIAANGCGNSFVNNEKKPEEMLTSQETSLTSISESKFLLKQKFVESCQRSTIKKFQENSKSFSEKAIQGLCICTARNLLDSMTDSEQEILLRHTQEGNIPKDIQIRSQNAASKCVQEALQK